MASAKGNPHDLQTPMAGLLLLQGDTAPIRRREAEVRAAAADRSAPNELSDIGWWFYMAGDYPAAAAMLRDAVQQRPSNASMMLRLGWTDIELRQLADALTTINSATEQPALSSERLMARAVAQWQAQDRDIALNSFIAATVAHSEWKNSHWVKMLYSPLVESSIEEMQTELERRKKVAQASRQ
jgi:Flp pilus assembly protein TadD